MLLRFTVANHASVRDEQELSLIALDDHADLAVSSVPRTGLHALPVVGIYGPNGSGKSAILKAMGFAASVIAESQTYWLPGERIPRWPFRLDDTSRAAPSTFVFEFVVDGTRYEYGFSLDDGSILDEWLHAWPRGRRSMLFEAEGPDVKYGTGLGGRKAGIAAASRENSLFLSAAAAYKHPQLAPVADWFRTLRLRSTTFNEAPLLLAPDERQLSLLKYADIGITGSVAANRDPDDAGLPARRARHLRSLRENRTRLDEIELTHQAATTTGHEALPWEWESAGTRAWTQLIRTADARLRQGGTMLVDDLGGTLHPALTAEFVGLFQRRETNPHGAQLIFTGHDVSLLGKHLDHRLRRDQVWLTEKAQDGATRLYPLTEYGRVRDGADDVEGRYLQGRYGAVPFFDRSLLAALDSSGDANGEA